MSHLVLLGDSIFDNGPYVDAGGSVSEILTALLEGETKVTMLAVDGDVTTDVFGQLNSFPENVTHTFVSCGGNDALQVVGVLNEPVSSVGEALDKLATIREVFRNNYRNMLSGILDKTGNVSVCTIYNAVPGLSEQASTALALFNEIILQEATKLGLPVIDLRNVCQEFKDYSPVSPIEPSHQGAEKISNRIINILKNHDFKTSFSVVYV